MPRQCSGTMLTTQIMESNVSSKRMVAIRQFDKPGMNLKTVEDNLRSDHALFNELILILKHDFRVRAKHGFVLVVVVQAS